MPRAKVDTGTTSWADVHEAVLAWEVEYGVRIEFQLHVRHNLSSGAYVETVVYDAPSIGKGLELVRTRQAFPIKKGSGHAGAVMYCLFSALREMESNAWSWSTRMRKKATE